MISSKGYSISEMEHKGFGGKLLLLSNPEKKYVLKAENQGQSINEYVAQHFLKALGFVEAPMELFKYDGRCYGSIEFQEGIRRVYPFQLADETEETRLTVLELFILNAILGNADEGEYYLKENTVISLDYGEALISPLWVMAAIQGRTADVRYSINVGLESKSAVTVMSRYYDNAVCQKAFERLRERMERFNLSDMTNCFESLDNAFFNGFSVIFEQYFETVREEMTSLHLVTI